MGTDTPANADESTAAAGGGGWGRGRFDPIGPQVAFPMQGPLAVSLNGDIGLWTLCKKSKFRSIHRNKRNNKAVPKTA